MITALFIVAFVCLGLALACWWADRQSPADTDEFVQPKHCTVTDKEPTRT